MNHFTSLAIPSLPQSRRKEVMTMDATQLKAAVNIVEQDHQLVLENLRALKDTVYCLMEPAKTSSGEVVTRLDEFNKFFTSQFEDHLKEEETTLFPLLEKDGSGGAEVVARLRKDHDDIRRKRSEFESCLKIAAASQEENIPPSILRDLLRYGLDFWEQLDTHAHFESRELHRCISQ
jgi:iron-sulfur cluster repair protein YtfE (RIC family)